MNNDWENDFEKLCRCVFLNNQQGIIYYKKDKVLLEELKLFFPKLVPGTPRPDGVSVIDDTALLMEHFQFDNSKKTNNGSKQNRASALTGKKMDEKLG